ncbi:MAG: sorbosone dehydrogenase [Caulobacter sp.]|nr:sorbosone dehydrogenase [Caulobacter sp.]
MPLSIRPALALLVVLLLAACTPKPGPSSATYGAAVPLAAPHSQAIPTINTAKPLGWPAGVTPKAPPGFQVVAFARGLDHPRQLLALPDGDVLAALSSSEAHKTKGFTAWFAQFIQKGAGALAKSANQIVLLRDADGDGVAETRFTLIDKGLNQPFGMAVIGDTLYVGNTDSVMAFPFPAGTTHIDAPGAKILDLPSGSDGRGHWTRSLLASPDGTRLYVGVGSGSNIADGGMGPEAGRARILEITLATGAARPYATGLRNPNSMSFEPSSGVMWTVVNERDMIGDNTPPDYMTGLKDGAFYGWPWSYYGDHVDDRVKPANPEMVAQAIAPDYALGAHTASLGLAFYPYTTGFPAAYSGGAFVGQHGSWNRSEPAGYKVVFVPFAEGRPAGPAQDFLTGFLKDPKHAYGRPVGVAVDRRGGLLVADDVGNVVWRVPPPHPLAPGFAACEPCQPKP